MKTALRSIASVILGVSLWFILYVALGFIVVLVAAYVPIVMSLIDLAVRFMYMQHWYVALFMGIPAIIPAILIKLITKDVSAKVQTWTLVVVIALIAINIFTIEGFNLIQKLEGIFGVWLAFWTLGQKN